MGKSSGGNSGGSDWGSLFAAQAAQRAAELQYQLGKEQLDWTKEVYNRYDPYIMEGTKVGLEDQKRQSAFAKQQEQFYTDTYQPLEAHYVQEAQNWDSPERRERMAGQAQAGVASQFEQARGAATQQLESFGVDPTSTRYAALDLNTRVQQAAAAAGAGTKAIQDTEQMGVAMKGQAINTGRGYSQAVAQTTGSSTGAGSQAQGGLTNFFGTSSNAMTAPVAWYQAGNQSMGNAIQGYNNYYRNTNPPQQQTSSGLGSALGLVGGMMTKFLEDGGPVDGGEVPYGASPSQGIATDDVPARLTAGEFVIPKDVVEAKGTEFFQKLISKTRGSDDPHPAEPSVGMAPMQEPTFVSNSAIPMR
jgi:hypothetical protein